ncbi:hypothetical protein CDL15_Pgr006161 [Punica granatum]|uniref:Uncharacterized protein n=1 Tax=Punica granatum TaxID=22663 RepID=A0A218VUE3_PUNGR|nr:hypothetical protein CDL15_Pgr006161 [Punica granatum]
MASKTERILNRTLSNKDTLMLLVILFHLNAPSSFHFIAVSFLSLFSSAHLFHLPIIISLEQALSQALSIFLFDLVGEK